MDSGPSYAMTFEPNKDIERTVPRQDLLGLDCTSNGILKWSLNEERQRRPSCFLMHKLQCAVRYSVMHRLSI